MSINTDILTNTGINWRNMTLLQEYPEQILDFFRTCSDDIIQDPYNIEKLLEFGYINILQIFIDRGIKDIDQIICVCQYEATLLGHLCYQLSNLTFSPTESPKIGRLLNIIQKILNKSVDVNKCKLGPTPLYHIANSYETFPSLMIGDKTLFQSLLNHGADPNIREFYNGVSPILSIYTVNTENLEDNRFDLDIMDYGCSLTIYSLLNNKRLHHTGLNTEVLENNPHLNGRYAIHIN